MYSLRVNKCSSWFLHSAIKEQKYSGVDSLDLNDQKT